MKIVIGYTEYPSLFQSLCQEFNERKTYILLSKMSKVTKEGLQKKFKKTKNFSCISDDAMIHCRQQKSKCFYLTDKCKQFVAMIKVPLQKFRKYEAKIC